MTKTRGLFRRSLDAFIAARERQAQVLVNRTLLSFDDETLRAHGYNRADMIKNAGGWKG